MVGSCTLRDRKIDRDAGAAPVRPGGAPGTTPAAVAYHHGTSTARVRRGSHAIGWTGEDEKLGEPLYALQHFCRADRAVPIVDDHSLVQHNPPLHRP